MRALPSGDLGFGILLGVIVWVALIVVRLAWTFLTTGLIRTLDRRPYQRTLRARHGDWSWTRSPAIAVPSRSRPRSRSRSRVAGGGPFPMRDLIVFVTAVVIVLTLGVQGPLFPLLVRWAQLPADTAADERDAGADRVVARRPRGAAPNSPRRSASTTRCATRSRARPSSIWPRSRRTVTPRTAPRRARTKEQYTRLRLAAMQVKRETVLRPAR